MKYTDKLHSQSLFLAVGKSINKVDLDLKSINRIKAELKEIKNNCTNVLKQLKEVGK